MFQWDMYTFESSSNEYDALTLEISSEAHCFSCSCHFSRTCSTLFSFTGVLDHHLPSSNMTLSMTLVPLSRSLPCTNLCDLPLQFFLLSAHSRAEIRLTTSVSMVGLATPPPIDSKLATVPLFPHFSTLICISVSSQVSLSSSPLNESRSRVLLKVGKSGPSSSQKESTPLSFPL